MLLSVPDEDPQYWEKRLYFEGFRFIAGVDEVGRGSLAGPVVAAAVILPLSGDYKGIADSKTLTAAQRLELDRIIRSQAISIGIGLIDHTEIDKINILRASLKAMQIAVSRLAPGPDYVLVDGNQPIPACINQKTLVDGDSRNLSIGAASILAKVFRDGLMDGYHLQYPQYNFTRNKGYCTRKHLEAINEFGCCPLHRRSFRPVKENLELRHKDILEPGLQISRDLFKDL